MELFEQIRREYLDKDTLIHLGETSKSGDPAPPSEEDLQENFTNNAETFDKLRQMSEEDAHVIRIAKDFTWTDTRRSGLGTMLVSQKRDGQFTGTYFRSSGSVRVLLAAKTTQRRFSL